MAGLLKKAPRKNKNKANTKILYSVKSTESLRRPISTAISKENETTMKLRSLGLSGANIEYLLEKGESFLGKSQVFAEKFEVTSEYAQRALQIIGKSKQEFLTQEGIDAIEECLQKNPGFNLDDIILLFDKLIPHNLIEEYLVSKPFSEGQKIAIVELFNKGESINDIFCKLKVFSRKNLEEYVNNAFITFSGEEGQKILTIIQKLTNSKALSASKLREQVKSRNLKLQDQLCCILPKSNEKEYLEIHNYFMKFEESKSFYDINTELSIEDICLIKEKNLNIEQLSSSLNKVETVIREHLAQYCPNQTEQNHYLYWQKKQINEILKFGYKNITLLDYRIIITDSINSFIEKAEQTANKLDEAFNQLLPLVFYYLKCSLSFENITMIIEKACKITLTSYDIFHMIFQMSDPVVRGLCIEHYSFSNPVPLFYPRLKTEVLRGDKIELNLCTELWYCLQEYHGIVSFGLGKASWDPIGKSYLLELIFGTDFVEGNPENSAFHLQSIDIQMTQNLFGELNTVSTDETTKWAYIDCHRYSDPKVIEIICHHLDIAIINVSYFDYQENFSRINEEILRLETYILHLYVFIRDCNETGATIQRRENTKTFIFLPNLKKRDMRVYSTIKEIGYEIIHLKNKNPKLIGKEFIESIMSELRCPDIEEIQNDKKIIQTITGHIKKQSISTPSGLSFLNYYPSFVKYMSFYYQGFSETEMVAINELNEKCVNLKNELENITMGDIVVNFNEILERNNSGLLLWRLSQELLALTNQAILQNKEVTQGYSVEIFWREALLSSKYGKNQICKSRDSFIQRFARNFSSHVERGEAFELIDGDNLRFFNKDINALLSQLYEKQFDDLSVINEGKKLCIRQAPIVVSIFGPQSSGKSTLLNYCFGCKFLTSAGRCTKGIYGSLAKLSQPINLTNQFLILDTEGLDAGSKKGPSYIHFDRTMVLFCLAVSQVVIINIRGELGEELQNLLQICTYSLLKLKVSKVVSPQIFFVLNQQADPDPNKHLDSISSLLWRIQGESDQIELEGTRVSDLIQVSRKNLFILPSAFNCVQMNMPTAKLFDSDVIKLSPTIAFANKCGELRQSIIDQLIEKPLDERATFNSMSEWLEMSGVIWETIIRYQDIVKYRNVDEMKGNNKLTKIVCDLMQKHIYSNETEFDNMTDILISEIKEITQRQSRNIILEEKMSQLNEVFGLHHERCLIEFNNVCQTDKLLNKMSHICEDMRLNLARLIYIERKKYKDRLKFQISAVLIENKHAENMEIIQTAFSQNVSECLTLSTNEQIERFGIMWQECFWEVNEEEENELEEDFDSLYSLFKMESKTIENKRTILQLFREHNFEMNAIVHMLRLEIQETFERKSTSSTTEDFIYPFMQNNIPIKHMTSFTGENKYEYLGKETLYTMDNRSPDPIPATALIPQISEWVPKSCHSLVNYCSGYFNHADITWEKEERKQIMLLASVLRDPQNDLESTWNKLIKNISSEVQEIIGLDPEISQSTVKQLVRFLCCTFKHINYEINYIQARLTIAAERTLTTLVFAYAFRSKWNKTQEKVERRIVEENKSSMLKYFLQKIKCLQMLQGNWNRKELRSIDKNFSNKFASDFIESVKRGVAADEHIKIEKKFREKKETLSHKRIILLIEELITKELESQPDKEITNQNNDIIRSICERNELVNDLFQRNWEKIVGELYVEIVDSLKNAFIEQIEKVKLVLSVLLSGLETKSTELGKPKELGFDSDYIFMANGKVTLSENKSHIRIAECLLKSSVYYLEMYLDPKVSLTQFRRIFKDTFKIDTIKMKKRKDSCILLDKPTDPNLILDKNAFKKLANTKMFNSEQIFNIYEYLKNFILVLESYEYEISLDEINGMLSLIKDDLKSLAMNCTSQCPSCGKFCEREAHPHGGRCQIRTGHQICSMGGRVWRNDTDKTAILFTCDDYADYSKVQVPGQKMTWSKFKEKTSNEWDWTLPNYDSGCGTLQEHNKEKMIKLWNKFGKGILNYHASKGMRIKYIPYAAFEESVESIKPTNYCICFVIDGTTSMSRAIEKTRASVKELIQTYEVQGNCAKFKIVIYRDHCDGRKIIEMFPSGSNFTKDDKSIEKFLKNVKVHGGGDIPEAVLDGLATATTKCNWTSSIDVKNIIIHIYDAPPHGNFPDYRSHNSKSDKGNCCCCNQGTMCPFDWEKDVWGRMSKFKINYNGISTGGKYKHFENTMKANLGELCGDFQLVGRETVNDAILSIFIDC